jgi:hypothetical protein
MEDIMDRKLQDKMNIALTRDERVLLWNLIGNEKDKIIAEIDKPYIEDYLTRRLKQLKVLEVLIVG